MTLTFVVGTGRCGSTMLSRILHEHPDVLSMNEFFGAAKAGAGKGRIPRQDMDGQELWAVLTTANPVLDAMIRDGLKTEELLYPYGAGRFSPASGVPMICHQVLPMLTDDPDALFDQLAAEVPGWPERPAASQYRALFSYLAGHMGRAVVVERSGGSLILVRQLHELFPDARFVHIYRDGPDCALSMSRHPGFRRETLLIGAMRSTRMPSAEEAQAALPAEFAGLIAPPFDMDRLMAFPIPLEVFGGQWWSRMIQAGTAALSDLPPGLWTGLSYEDLLSDAEAELSRLAGFIGVPAAPRWLRAARDVIQPGRAGTAAAQLDPAALASLRAACEPGTRAIADLAGRRVLADPRCPAGAAPG